MPFRPQAPPKKLPIDLAVVDTARGGWLIAVETIAQTEGTANLLLGIILEQNIDNERFRMRRLGVMVDTREAHDPDKCSSLLDRIRKWIEASEGDGFLDLTRTSS
jgi:hypothetical protein